MRFSLFYAHIIQCIRCYCIFSYVIEGKVNHQVITRSAASSDLSIDASTAACRGIPASNGTRTFFLLFSTSALHRHAFTFNDASDIFGSF